MRSALLIMLTFFVIGCGEQNKQETAQRTGNPESVVTACGVIGYEPDTKEFDLYCNLDKESWGSIKDLTKANLKKEQLCNVYYDENGQPERFSCKEMPESIDSFIAKGATLTANWECTGLDGFGGYHSKNISNFVLHDNGSFELLLRAKKDTDSIWHITDSVISGNYETSKDNRLLLIPESWTSKEIDSVGLGFEKADEFMLVKPLMIEISDLTRGSFHGVSRWKHKLNDIASNVKCTKIDADLNAKAPSPFDNKNFKQMFDVFQMSTNSSLIDAYIYTNCETNTDLKSRVNKCMPALDKLMVAAFRSEDKSLINKISELKKKYSKY